MHAHETHVHQMHAHQIHAHRSVAFLLGMKYQRTQSGNRLLAGSLALILLSQWAPPQPSLSLSLFLPASSTSPHHTLASSLSTTSGQHFADSDACRDVQSICSPSPILSPPHNLLFRPREDIPTVDRPLSSYTFSSHNTSRRCC